MSRQSLPDFFDFTYYLTAYVTGGNELTGRLPDTFGGLVGLTELQLAENKLRGNVGTYLGSLTNLVTVVLGMFPMKFRY